MRKIHYILSFFMALTITSVESKEWELKDRPVLTFHEALTEDQDYYEVKLKAVKMSQEDYDKSLQGITLTYIVTLHYPLSKSEGTIVMSLTDKEGFEIASRELSRVVENYKGTIKGKFILKPSEYQKIYDVELNFLVPVK